jgi:hypothetical protein
MNSVIIGMGEVGQALRRVLVERKAEDVFSYDPKDGDTPGRLALIATKGVDVAHVCYPFNPDRDAPNFAASVRVYARELKVSLVIVHSTVPVGTTRAIGPIAVHSPIHGQHQHLSRGIRTFLKYVGGADEGTVTMALGYLLRHGIRAYPVSSPEASELSKLLCTAQYGWQIILCKEVAAIAARYGVPFAEVYTDWNREYNRSYAELHPVAPGGQPKNYGNLDVDVHRPTLHPTPGPIGGHCVIPNAKLVQSWLTDLIVERNKHYEGKAKAEKPLDVRTAEKVAELCNQGKDVQLTVDGRPVGDVIHGRPIVPPHLQAALDDAQADVDNAKRKGGAS